VDERRHDEAVILRAATRDDAGPAAALLIEIPGGLAEIVGDEPAAQRMAFSAFRSRRSSFSYAQATVAEDSARVVGVIVFVTGRQWRRRRASTGLAMLASANLRSAWRLVYRGSREARLVPSVPADALYVVSVAVAPEGRGKGTGTRLLEHVIAEARASGSPAVFLDVRADNEAAVELYRRLGFVVVSEHAHAEARGLPAATSLRMELRLRS
jgi:ribosomal protein S18 acetylase RimI-like enzyme